MSSESEAVPTSSVHLAFCVLGVWLTWSVHDYLQERIFRMPGFHFGFFMAFLLQAVSFILSLASQVGEWLWARAGEESRRAADDAAREKEQQLREEALDEEQRGGLLTDEGEGGGAGSGGGGAPAASEEEEALGSRSSSSTGSSTVGSALLGGATWTTLALYLVLSLLIAAANGSATVALNYVSMPVKVLFKSSKIVTVMGLGVLCFGRRYAPSEYAYMLLVVGGLASFLLANAHASRPLSASLTGVALLSLAVLSDSLVPNVQQKLLRTRPKQELIFHTNWVSASLTLAYMLATGEAAPAFAYAARRPRVLALMLLQALAGYLGIVVYLETVRCFGSKVTVLVTSCRKLFTIGLSSIAFGHALTPYHVGGASAVFLGVLLNAERERPCSRLVALPCLLLVVGVLALQLRLDQLAGQPALTIALDPVRELLGKPLL